MKIILASKSGVRKKILENNKIDCEVVVSNVDEDEVKSSLLAEGANPLLISKNLAEIKSVKVSNKNPDRLVLGADSVISLNNELINKPKSRDEAFKNSSILASQINRINAPEVGEQVLEQIKNLTQGGIPRMLPAGLLLHKLFYTSS